MPRPTKYSEAVAEAICNALRIGATRMAAAEHVGVCYDTFREWCLRFPQFSVAVTRAEAEAEVNMTAVIARAAKGTADQAPDWRAAESWLKRRRRAAWGDSLDIRKLDDETLLRLLALEGGGSETQPDAAGRRLIEE